MEQMSFWSMAVAPRPAAVAQARARGGIARRRELPPVEEPFLFEEMEHEVKPKRKMGCGGHEPWTEEEDRRLREEWLDLAAEARAALAAEFGRTLTAVRMRARSLGLKARSPRAWTAEDDAIVRELYWNKPTAIIARRLKRRAEAVRWRAAQLGLHRPRRRWTPEEDAKLLELLGTLPVSVVAKRLDRSEHSVRGRLLQLDEGVLDLRTAMTPAFAAMLVGRDASTVRSWCERRLLKAKQGQAGGHWLIEPKALRSFIASYPREVIVRRSERPLELIELLVGAVGVEGECSGD